jgi:hypothetical protein
MLGLLPTIAVSTCTRRSKNLDKAKEEESQQPHKEQRVIFICMLSIGIQSKGIAFALETAPGWKHG